MCFNSTLRAHLNSEEPYWIGAAIVDSAAVQQCYETGNSLASFHFDHTYLKCEKMHLKLNFLRRVFQNPNKQVIKTTIYFSFQTYLNQSLLYRNVHY